MARHRQAGEDETGANRLPARAATDKAEKPPEPRPTGVRFEDGTLTVDTDDGEAVVVPAGAAVVANGVAVTDPAKLAEWFDSAKKAVSVPGKAPAVRLTVGRNEAGEVTSVRLDQ